MSIGVSGVSCVECSHCRNRQDEVLDKYKMVYDQGLDRVKFPSDISAEADGIWITPRETIAKLVNITKLLWSTMINYGQLWLTMVNYG